MTGFVLKIIAVITMILDHVKYAVPVTDCFITQYLGRISFPLFAFLIAEGMRHTSNRKKYFIRMTIFAIISQLPFMLFRSLVAPKFLLNIMFTFAFAIIGIFILDFFGEKNEMPKLLRFMILYVSLTTILAVGYLIPVDYGWFGIATVWLFYIINNNNKILRTITYTLLVVLYYLSIYMPSMLEGQSLDYSIYLKMFFTMLPGILILFYNGKKGKGFKYFFYAFYPIHMLIIYGLSFLF